MLYICFIPKNFINNNFEDVNSTIQNILKYYSKSYFIKSIEEYKEEENEFGYYNVINYLSDTHSIDLNYLDPIVNEVTNGEEINEKENKIEYKTSNIYFIPKFGGFILKAVSLKDRIKSSSYEINKILDINKELMETDLIKLTKELNEANSKVDIVRRKISRFSVLRELKRLILSSGLRPHHLQPEINRIGDNNYINIITLKNGKWAIENEKTGEILISDEILDNIKFYFEKKNKIIRDVYDELSIFKDTDEEGDIIVPEIVIDDFHDKKYSMKDLNKLLFKEDRENLIFERNEEKIRMFSEEYEDFIDVNKDIIIEEEIKEDREIYKNPSFVCFNCNLNK